MSSTDRVATAFRAARRARNLSLRDVDQLTRELATGAPDFYETISRGTLNTIENEGEAYFAHGRNLTETRLRTLVQALWSGDSEAFTRDTGVALLHRMEKAEPAPERLVPLYVEGGAVEAGALRTGQDALRPARPALPGADVLLEVTSELNQPVVWPGQVVGVTLTTTPEARRLTLLLTRGKLVLAWMLTPEKFAFTNVERAGPGVFPLRNGDVVLGVVAWIVPQMPAAPIRSVHNVV